MAPTTTMVSGCNAVVRIDDSGGSLQDMSGSSNKVDIEAMNELGEFKPFGTQWKNRIQCGKDLSLALASVFTEAADEAHDLLSTWFEQDGGAARTIQVSIPDETSGSKRYSGEFLLEKYTMNVDAASPNPVPLQANFKPDGEVTIATI